MDELFTNARLEFLVFGALIGCITGGVFGGLISKKFGRKNRLIWAAALFLIYTIGSGMPEMLIKPIGKGDHKFIYIFAMYRIIGGVCSLASILLPLYIA